VSLLTITLCIIWVQDKREPKESEANGAVRRAAASFVPVIR
jgi:hypothetical protein